MKDIFVVIGYDSIFNGEEVCAVFYDIYKAEEYREKEGKMRVEHHIIKDAACHNKKRITKANAVS